MRIILLIAAICCGAVMANAQCCAAASTACQPSKQCKVSGAAATSTAGAATLASAQSATPVAQARFVSTTAAPKGTAKACAKAADCNPANCNPANCDPSKCAPCPPGGGPNKCQKAESGVKSL